MEHLYLPVLEPDPEGGFTIYFPNLPGCVTIGDTVEEALRMGEEALDLYLESVEVHGDPIPKPGQPRRANLGANPFPHYWNQVWNEGVKADLVRWARAYLGQLERAKLGAGGGLHKLSPGGLTSRFAREVLDRAIPPPLQPHPGRACGTRWRRRRGWGMP